MCFFTKTLMKKMETGKKMRLQTDSEFGQNKNKDRIKRITIISFVLKFAVVRLLQ